MKKTAPYGLAIFVGRTSTKSRTWSQGRTTSLSAKSAWRSAPRSSRSINQSKQGRIEIEQTLYKVTSAMKKLDVCRATIYRMASRGELDLVKMSERATRVTADSIQRAIDAGKRKS